MTPCYYCELDRKEWCKHCIHGDYDPSEKAKDSLTHPPLLTDEQMPPLPEPGAWYFDGGESVPTDSFTDKQMREYGRAVEAAVRKQILGQR